MFRGLLEGGPGRLKPATPLKHLGGKLYELLSDHGEAIRYVLGHLL